MGFFDFIKKKELAEIAKLKTKLERYKEISDIEDEVERQLILFENLIKQHNIEIKNIESSLSELNSKYKNGLETYNKLIKTIKIYENKVDLIEFGISEPVYNFEKSDQYRTEQAKIIQLQKEMINSDRAAISYVDVSIDGNKAWGGAVVKTYKKLMLKAFNGECDYLVSKVKWNNITQMKERIQKSFESINKLGLGFHISINKEYLELKLKELLLEYEYQSKKQQEKEELRAIQAEIKEEEKAIKEFEKAQREAEKEEAEYQKALKRAREEFEASSGARHYELLKQIEELEKELKIAQDKKERAISMAQQTKQGHIYVISNIGSFGENVFKIGMTRRLEPIERIRELGDASVPFHFDIHAMIYSKDAPTLEKELHNAFADKKINMVNYRKEFFNVSLEDIEHKVKEIGIVAEFSRFPEAMEFRETIAVLEKNKNIISLSLEKDKIDDFPNSIF